MFVQPWLVAIGGWQLATGGWWRLVVVGGGWWLVIGGSWWWLALGGWSPLAVGGWRLLAVGGWRSFGTVLNKKKLKKIQFLQDPPGQNKKLFSDIAFGAFRCDGGGTLKSSFEGAFNRHYGNYPTERQTYRWTSHSSTTPPPPGTCLSGGGGGRGGGGPGGRGPPPRRNEN